MLSRHGHNSRVKGRQGAWTLAPRSALRRFGARGYLNHGLQDANFRIPARARMRTGNVNLQESGSMASTKSTKGPLLA